MAAQPYMGPFFTIEAKSPKASLSQTRRVRAAAVVLAMQWATLGYNDVRIIDPEGQAYTLETFRKLFVPKRPDE